MPAALKQTVVLVGVNTVCVMKWPGLSGTYFSDTDTIQYHHLLFRYWHYSVSSPTFQILTLFSIIAYFSDTDTIQYHHLLFRYWHYSVSSPTFQILTLFSIITFFSWHIFKSLTDPSDWCPCVPAVHLFRYWWQLFSLSSWEPFMQCFIRHII